MCNYLNNPFTSKETCPIMGKRAADNYNALFSIGHNGKKANIWISPFDNRRVAPKNKLTKYTKYYSGYKQA